MFKQPGEMQDLTRARSLLPEPGCRGDACVPGCELPCAHGSGISVPGKGWCWSPLSYLPGGFHPFPQAEVDNGKDEEEAEEQLPADAPHIIQTPRLLDLQDLPPVGRDPRGRGGCLRLARCCWVSPCRQPGSGLSPGQAVPRSPLPQHTKNRDDELPKSILASEPASRHPGPAPRAADPSSSTGMSPSLNTPCTYMHLRIKLFSRGPGEVGPGHIASPKVVGAGRCVPGVVAARPGQGAREGRVEVVESPGNDGVVVEGDVQANDANSKADAWGKRGPDSAAHVGPALSLAPGTWLRGPAWPRSPTLHGPKSSAVAWGCGGSYL